MILGNDSFTLKSWSAAVARRRQISKKKQNLIKDLKIGDLVKYCPKDLDPKFYDIGLIIEIDTLYEIKSTNKIVYKYNIFWQKENTVTSYTSNHIINSLSQKYWILI